MSNDYPPPADGNTPQDPTGWDASSQGGQSAPQSGSYGAPANPPYQSGGYSQGGYSGAPKPDNNLVWAILSTLLCCMPFGIVSIVYATKVDGLWMTGQYSAAQDAAAKAKKWAIVAAASGVAVGVVYFVFIMLFGILAGSDTSSM